MKKFFFMIMISLFVVSNYSFSQGKDVASKGYGINNKDDKFHYMEFSRRPVGDNDILINIMYSAICHSDIHTARGDWGSAIYPLVPGHEIVGKVAEVGKNVKNFKVGETAGVGCMVDSCGVCEYCKKDLEQFCSKGAVFTYDSRDYSGKPTYGGYSNNIVVKSSFAFKIPDSIPIERAAPLLCAGITTYSALKKGEIKAGDKVAVAGFGGLGHMALQYAISMGADVTVFDITESKRQIALEMGAKKYVNTKSAKESTGMHRNFDLIISTISDNFNLDFYLNMLTIDGKMVIVGIPSTPLRFSLFSLINGRRSVIGSLIGGLKETQETIDYSAKNKIYPKVEIISADEINDAYAKVINGDVLFRLL